MKSNYILTLVLTLIVGISVGIFGLSTYQILTNNDNNQEEKENNHQSNQLANISYKEAKQLFEKVTVWQSGNVFGAFAKNPNKTSLSIEEIDASDLAYMLFDTKKLEKAQICETQHESNLKKLNIIGDIGVGQYDCKSDIFYTIDSVKAASKEVFGKELSQFTTATDKNSGYYYYENGNIAIIRYAGVLDTTYTMTDFYVKDSVLSIELSGSNNKSYKLNFNVVDNNYYFESVDRL